ncbi:LPXTG cell wall anchor domain-containing protein [Metabacillus sp. Hm71]|uniref:LPXTG cell wall anchor domain-containing protein n=1 Tax=Metabacillus sp. Hm71 TaxID=3450743 RepID=UPI003F43B946
MEPTIQVGENPGNGSGNPGNGGETPGSGNNQPNNGADPTNKLGIESPSDSKSAESATSAILPITATDTYTILLIGIVISLAGAALIYLQKRKTGITLS